VFICVNLWLDSVLLSVYLRAKWRRCLDWALAAC
jgi:hypothetical protein